MSKGKTYQNFVNEYRDSAYKECVGNRIKNIRRKLGLSQEEFGEELDNDAPAHKSLVSKWENGMNLPNNKRLKRIAEIGGTTVDYIVNGGQIMSKENRTTLMECAKSEWHRMIYNGMTWKAAREEIEKDYEFTDEEKIKFRWWLVGVMESYQEAGAVKWKIKES